MSGSITTVKSPLTEAGEAAVLAASVDSGDVFLGGGISKGIGAVVFLGKRAVPSQPSFFAFVRSAQSGNREGQYKKSGGKNFLVFFSYKSS